MNKGFGAVIVAIVFGLGTGLVIHHEWIKPIPVTERPTHRHDPHCSRTPQSCIGGTIVIYDQGSSERAFAYRVVRSQDHRAGDGITYDVEDVDFIVSPTDGGTTATFYWPDDQDKTGERVFNSQKPASDTE